MTSLTGIYTVTNIIDNKIYVGYSKNCNKRFAEHTSLLLNNKHKNLHLQNAWNKYGKDKFVFEILEECDKQYLASQEHYWVITLNTRDFNFGYNILPTHPFKLNSGHSLETKSKQRLSALKRKNYKEQLEQLRISNVGKKASVETLEKMSKNREVYKYKIIDKEGNIYDCTNLRKFSKQHNIDVRGMSMTFKNNVFRYGFKIISKEPL